MFFQTFGFPDFYGRNMNAWIDCMSYLDDSDAGMSKVNVEIGEVLVICLSGGSNLRKRCPELFDALIDCSAFVNYRRIETGQQSILAISFR